MIPVQVTIRLGTPVMLSYPWIMLDSLLMHLALELDHPDLLASLDPRQPVPLDEVTLPVAKNGEMFKVSCSRFSEHVQAAANIRKKIEPGDAKYLATPPKNIDIQRGAFKAYDMRMVTINASTCTFHAIGDVAGLERLLQNLDGLGKKRAAGFGRVLSVTVEPCGEDHHLVHPVHGLNRPVPVEVGERVPGIERLSPGVATLAYKPPYWSKEGHVPCYIPGGF